MAPRLRSISFVAAALIGASAAFVPTSAGAQTFGRITGRVDAADTRLALPGARVSVDGTVLTAVAGDEGRFLFSRVAVGVHTLRVTYLGRTPMTRQITVAGEQTVTANFSLETVTLTPVMVRAGGQADALSRQQNADNIKSVVSADQMGRFPDASAPEAVQRLPGVALQRDQGEGRYIQLRGASAATTQVRINGEEIGSPEADVRQIALDAIPVGVLGAVEVVKAITPDMDADAIGGSVNLITKRASAGRTFTAEGSGGFAPLRERGSGTGAITLGNRVMSDRLGWLLTGSFGERNFGSDDIEPDYDDDDLSELEVRHYTLWRRRSGLSGAFDFRANDRSSYYVNGLWSELQDHEQRRALAHAIEDNELAYLHKNRLEKLSTFNVLFGGEHLLPRGLTLNHRLGFTRSKEDTPFDYEAAFLQEDVDYSPSRANPERPQSNPQGNALAGRYVFDELSTGGTLTKNRDWVGGADLGIPFSFGSRGAGTLQFGAKYRDKKKDQRVDAFQLELADDASDIVLGSDVGGPFSNSGFVPGAYPMPFTTSPNDIKGFESRFRTRLTSREADAEAQVEAYDLTERVWATYAMARLDVTPRLLLLPGVRVEGTSLTTRGNEFDAEEETLSPRTATRSYTNFFPMAHLRYRLNDDTNLRGAFTSTIFRPNFLDLVPYSIRDGEDLEQGNPQLTATTARNLDLMFERYDRSVGLVSAGAFYKRLQNPIFTHTADNDLGGETSQPVNATSGEIFGLELALQKRLTFLPGALNGFGIYANYTWTDSKATQPTGRETRLAGQSENAFNLALSYEKRGFSGQISMNRVGSYIDELGEDAEDDLIADARTQVDLSLSYFARPTTQIFFEALNLGNSPYRTYQFASDRIRQLEFYKPALQLGVRFHP